MYIIRASPSYSFGFQPLMVCAARSLINAFHSRAGEINTLFTRRFGPDGDLGSFGRRCSLA